MRLVLLNDCDVEEACRWFALIGHRQCRSHYSKGEPPPFRADFDVLSVLVHVVDAIAKGDKEHVMGLYARHRARVEATQTPV